MLLLLGLATGMAEGDGGGLKAELEMLRKGRDEGVLLREGDFEDVKEDFEGGKEDFEGDFWMLKGFGYGFDMAAVESAFAVDDEAEEAIVEVDAKLVDGQGGELPRC
jgi:hypothetical protein